MLRLFNNQEQLIKLVKEEAITSLRQKRSLSDRYVSDFLSVEMVALSEEELNQIEYMAIPYIDNPKKYHLFFVASAKTEGNLTILEGVQSGIEELRKKPIMDLRPTNMPLRTISERLVDGSNWQIGYVPSDSLVTSNFYHISSFEALKKVCESANVEMEFSVEVSTTRIMARMIDFKKKIGKASGRRVVYGHNALKIIKETSKTDLYTALIGLGKGLSTNGEAPFIKYAKDYTGPMVKTAYIHEDASVDLTFFASGEKETNPKIEFSPYYNENPKDVAYITVNRDGTNKPTMVNRDGQSGFSDKLSISEARWERSKGFPLDKPLGQEYLEDPSATQIYGVKVGGVNLPKIGFFDAGDIEDPFELMWATYNELMQRNRPALTMRTDSLYLPDTDVGDTVRVVRPDRNYDYETRVFEVVWDRLTNATNDMKLGDRTNATDSAKQLSSMVAGQVGSLKNQVDSIFNDLATQIPSANGYNKNNYTSAEPQRPRIGDLWFKPDPEREGEYIILRWTGEVWEKLMSKDFSKELQAKFDEIFAKASALEQAIADAEARANQAIADAGLKTLTDAKAYAEAEALKRYNEAVAEASRLDEILSSAQQSYADKKVTDSINALKVEYIDVKLGDYVKTATYQVGVNGINSMISAIKNNPSANIVGWGDLANKTYVQSAINATASEIGASVREYIDGTTYKETIVKMTQDSINQTISRVTQGKVTSINQLSYTVNGMQNLISNPDGIANQVLASNLFKTEISNSVGSSIQTQMADYWSAQIKNSGGDIITAINATTGGVQIKGDLIRLTGTTVMDDAFANKLLTNTVSTTTVSAFTGIFSTLIAQNLDINNISGNHGEFISLGLKARYSYMNLTGNGLEIGDYAGEWLAKHDRQGIKFFNQGKHTATIQNVEDVAGMFESVTTLVAEGWYNGAVALSYRKRVGENSSRVLWVSGSEGKLNTSGLLYYNDTQYGIQYYKNTITDTGEGVLITSTHDTSAAICFVNGKVWYKTSAHGWRDLDRLALAY